MADKITVEQAGPDTRVITAYRPAEPDPDVTHAVDEACQAIEKATGKAAIQDIEHFTVDDGTPVTEITVSPGARDVSGAHYAHEAELRSREPNR
jgi:hypothetical protein